MLQAEPGPQEEPMVGMACALLAPGPPHPWETNAVDRPQWRFGRHAAQPFGQRDAKALFRALDDRLRQQPSRHLFQEVLPFAVAQFEVVRQPAAELDQIVVEKYRAGFGARPSS